MVTKRAHLYFAIFIGILLSCSWATGQQPPTKKTASAGTTSSVTGYGTGYRGARYEPRDVRDPFLNPLAGKKKDDPDTEIPKGTPPPGIAGMNIKDVELVGISTNGDSRTALFRGADQRVYFLHAGDHFFDGYLKTVSIDAVQMVRATTLRSGKVLTQEITKRLRN